MIDSGSVYQEVESEVFLKPTAESKGCRFEVRVGRAAGGVQILGAVCRVGCFATRVSLACC